MRGKLPFDTFDFYFGLGPSRSYQAVADHYGVTKRAVCKLAARIVTINAISANQR
jgi:hypothetical protein